MPRSVFDVRKVREKENRIICPMSKAMGQMIRPSERIVVALCRYRYCDCCLPIMV